MSPTKNANCAKVELLFTLAEQPTSRILNILSSQAPETSISALHYYFSQRHLPVSAVGCTIHDARTTSSSCLLRPSESASGHRCLTTAASSSELRPAVPPLHQRATAISSSSSSSHCDLQNDELSKRDARCIYSPSRQHRSSTIIWRKVTYLSTSTHTWHIRE